MAKVSICKPGSAWHTWQRRGIEWREANPEASNEQALHAAKSSAITFGWPDAGKAAYCRAFMEGAGVDE